MPVIRDQMHIVPATTNPLGVKGVGEAATTGAIATVMSAVDDAIAGAPGIHGHAGDVREDLAGDPRPQRINDRRSGSRQSGDLSPPPIERGAQG
jgi:hypothetical protein